MLKSHLAFCEDIQEYDEPVLENIIDIRTEHLPDETGMDNAGTTTTRRDWHGQYEVGYILDKHGELTQNCQVIVPWVL